MQEIKQIDFFSQKTDIEVTRLNGDASSREYFRVTASRNEYIVQKNIDGSVIATFKYFQNLFKDLGVLVPEIFFSNNKFVVMEDLGNVSLQDLCLANTNDSKNIYKSIIKELVNFSNNSIETKQRAEKSNYYLEFDEEKLNWEMEFFAKFYFKDLADAKVFLISFKLINQYLSSRCRVLCHRDFHSRNIMVKNNKSYWIDFQDARWGPVSYDLVSLLWDPYVRLSEEVVSDLLEYWIASLEIKEKPLLDELYVEIECMKAQRFFKACGSFLSFKELKRDNSYMQWFDHSFQTALSALKKVSEDTRFKQCAEAVSLLSK